MDFLALQLEKHARDASECSPGGTYGADGMLGNTGVLPQSPGFLSIS